MGHQCPAPSSTLPAAPTAQGAGEGLIAEGRLGCVVGRRHCTVACAIRVQGQRGQVGRRDAVGGRHPGKGPPRR